MQGLGLMWTEIALGPRDGPRGPWDQLAWVRSRREAGWWCLKAVCSETSEMESNALSHCHTADTGEEVMRTSPALHGSCSFSVSGTLFKIESGRREAVPTFLSLVPGINALKLTQS